MSRKLFINNARILARVSARVSARVLVLVAAWLLAAPDSASALRYAAPTPDQVMRIQTLAPSGRIVVKFAANSPLSMGDGNALVGAATPAGRRFTDLLGRIAPAAEMEKRFSRSAAVIEAERVAAESLTGIDLPDLNRYAQITGAASRNDRAALSAILRELLADPAVETAFLEPVAVPAALGFDAFDPFGWDPLPRRGELPRGDRTTPDFMDLQGYLDPAPDGIDIFAVAGNAGADGAGVSVIDIEGAWLWAHEDLPDPFIEIGVQFDHLSWRNHGTAVMGEIRGIDNSLGVRGITPAAAVGAASIAEQSTADAINNAAAALSVGDIILIELHAPGPNSGGGPVQFGYICMEFWQDNFDAILLASASGKIVCEAAGNGQQDFDDPIYMGLFDRNVRDSGALVIGATNGSILAPAWFTNYGSRVDINGWGSFVTTCGYGTLQGDSFPEVEWYSDTFSGTSSASPIVVGAVASLQGMVKEAYGFPLDARLALDILDATGTIVDQLDREIGNRPNLAAAWALASAGIGRVSGSVTDADSGAPVAGVDIRVLETTAFAKSAADGSFSLPLVAGDYSLDFSDFLYTSKSVPVTITGGATSTLDVVLDLKPSWDIRGYVFSETSEPLGDVRVEAIGLPVASTSSLADGSWSLGQIPWEAGDSYDFFFDGLPGHGADLESRWLSDAGLPGWGAYGGPILAVLPLPTEDFEADDGGFTSDGIWTWGAPAAGGPSGGFSGAKCWGVGMAGDYGDEQSDFLVSPGYDFAGESQLFLSLHLYRGTESCCDGVNLQVFSGGEWQVREPLNGYTTIVLGGLEYRSGWSGESEGWEGAVFDLTDLISNDVRFRLAFGSDGGVVGPGFWIDDIAFDTGAVVSTGTSGGPAAPNVNARLSAFPNPFNPKVTLAWSLPKAPVGKLELNVYDASGRRVRRLPVSETELGGSVVWDGRDGAGLPSPSGIYLARLSAGGDALASRRIVLAK